VTRLPLAGLRPCTPARGEPRPVLLSEIISILPPCARAARDAPMGIGARSEFAAPPSPIRSRANGSRQCESAPPVRRGRWQRYVPANDGPRRADAGLCGDTTTLLILATVGVGCPAGEEQTGGGSRECGEKKNPPAQRATIKLQSPEASIGFKQPTIGIAARCRRGGHRVRPTREAADYCQAQRARKRAREETAPSVSSRIRARSSRTANRGDKAEQVLFARTDAGTEACATSEK